jgi:hypothetical protein
MVAVGLAVFVLMRFRTNLSPLRSGYTLAKAEA